MWLYSMLYKIYGDLIIVNFDFTAILLSVFFSKIIYYCNDDFMRNSRFSVLFDKYFNHCERIVAFNSKFCIVTSKFLAIKLKSINPDTFEIPLGVSINCGNDFKLINHQCKKKITIGLMGYINSRQVPVELINRIIDNDNFQLILIGPIEKSFIRKLQRLDNVRITYALKDTDLISELLNTDICLALYNLKKINLGTTSNKLWQYLSLGKPVILSNLPNLQDMIFPEKSVYILLNEDDLINTIIKAFKEDSEYIKNSRKEFALQNTWDHRISKFLEFVRFYFPNDC